MEPDEGMDIDCYETDMTSECSIYLFYLLTFI